MEAAALSEIVARGDIAVVGDVRDAQLAAVELGVELLVLSTGRAP